MAATFNWRRRLLSAGGVAAVALLGGIWWYGHRPVAPVFTQDERAPFVTIKRKGEWRLLHPTLGFSVLHPGRGFMPTEAQPFRADAQFYTFIDEAARERVAIGLFKGQGDSAASLRSLLEAMGREAGTLGGTSGDQVRIVSLDTPDGDPPRGTLHAVVGDRRHYRLQAYGWDRGELAPIAVLIAVLSPAEDAHADLLASFQP